MLDELGGDPFQSSYGVVILVDECGDRFAKYETAALGCNNSNYSKRQPYYRNRAHFVQKVQQIVKLLL